MDFETYYLENKARVILIPLSDTRSLTTLVMYPVGSRNEPEHLAGASHFIEHMMFKGTKRRKNTLTLTREIDRLGAEYNAFTGKEYTGYYIKTDGRYSAISFDILSDMLFDSLFNAEEMKKEKHVIVEEIRMYNDNPIMNIDTIFEEVMYAGALGRNIAGSEAHVLGYKRSDVLAYKKQYYHPSRMTIVIAGAVDSRVREQISTYFDQKQSGHPAVRKKTSNTHHFGTTKKDGRIAVQHKKTDQTQLMIGFPGFKYDTGQHATLSVLNTLLGGSMSSRLFIKIRERLGLAYSVRSGAEKFSDTGYAYVRAGLDAGNINKAIAAIRSEIESIQSKGVSAREIKDAQTHIRGSMTLSLEDSSTVANWFATQALFYKKIQTPEERLKEIERVTKKDVESMARKVYNFNTMRVGIIGDVQKEDIIF